MSPAAIPAWTPDGLLPPIGSDPVSPDRSPYRVALVDFVERFATSPARTAILDGLLRYRAALHAAGLVSGLQWLDGSFLEDIETHTGRPPRDVDVVTFYQRPNGQTPADLLAAAPSLFDPRVAKSNYGVDAYTVDLAWPQQRMVRVAAYWYSMWSHRRDLVWKGYLEVDLAPDHDQDAAARLAIKRAP